MDVPYDKADQLNRTREALLPDEHLDAVFDLQGMGSGFVAITDRRLMLQD